MTMGLRDGDKFYPVAFTEQGGKQHVFETRYSAWHYIVNLAREHNLPR
jgi:hypothetical protein